MVSRQKKLDHVAWECPSPRAGRRDRPGVSAVRYIRRLRPEILLASQSGPDIARRPRRPLATSPSRTPMACRLPRGATRAPPSIRNSAGRVDSFATAPSSTAALKAASLKSFDDKTPERAREYSKMHFCTMNAAWRSRKSSRSVRVAIGGFRRAKSKQSHRRVDAEHP